MSVVVFICLILLSFSSEGATFFVDTAADTNDAWQGDGVCANARGRCSLRAAIREANALPGHDTIQLSAGTYTLTRSGSGEDAAATGDLDLLEDVTIVGAGRWSTIIDASALSPRDRVFDIRRSVDVVFRRLGITGGGFSSLVSGGGINQTGNGALRIIGCSIYENQAANGGGLHASRGDILISNSDFRSNTACGGGIYFSSPGSLRVVNSRFRNHVYADCGGGGITMRAQGTLDISESMFVDNQMKDGGAIMNYSSDARIVESNFFRNHAENHGGAIINQRGGSMHVTESTFGRNSAVHHGGAIYNAELLRIERSTIYKNQAHFGAGLHSAGEESVVVNSTFSENDAVGRAGAISANRGTVYIFSSTITQNQAKQGGGVFAVDGFGDVRLKNTILAGNLALSSGPDCAINSRTSSAITSLGYNVIGDRLDCNLASSSTDQVGDSTETLGPIDPMLDLLAVNGGRTQTHQLQANSPALDAGNPQGCTDEIGRVLRSDQRGMGFYRHKGVACDIGAFEL